MKLGASAVELGEQLREVRSDVARIDPIVVMQVRDRQQRKKYRRSLSGST
jgi:hypothetical protein